jgi:hypothetical protein
LCPLSLTSVVNGVYYYHCLNCDQGGSPCGGQDTRSHTTGISCSCILDPIYSIKRGRTVQKVKAHEVICFRDAVNNGMDGPPITFNKADFDVYVAPDGVTVLDLDKNIQATYRYKGRPINARLFRVQVTLLSGRVLTYHLGQELDNQQGIKPYIVYACTLDGDGDNQGRCHHRIQPDGSPDLYHVLVTPPKKKPSRRRGKAKKTAKKKAVKRTRR